MTRHMRVSEAAKQLNVSRYAVYDYVRKGLLEHDSTPGGQAVFTQEQINAFLGKEPMSRQPQATVFYVRDSTGSEINIQSQIDKLTSLYGRPDKIYKDKASGLNEKRPRLSKMIEDAEAGKIDRICITAKDRLTRFGYTYLEKMFGLLNVRIEILDDKLIEKEPHEELMQDFMSLIASFSGKFYRMRSNRHKKKLLNMAIDQIEDDESDSD